MAKDWCDCCGQPFTNDNDYEAKQIAAKRFERLHKLGAKRYGFYWLQANVIMSRIASEDYIPETRLGDTDIRFKCVLTEAAWQLACEMKNTANKLDRVCIFLKGEINHDLGVTVDSRLLVTIKMIEGLI